MNKTKYKFYRVLGILLAISFLAFAGCSSQKLSDKFDEEDVRDTAAEVIYMLNERDTEGLKDMSTEKLDEALTDEVLEQMYTAIEEGGEFKQTQDFKVIGSNENGGEYAVVIVKADYENKSLTYTISFNEEMKLAGLYYK